MAVVPRSALQPPTHVPAMRVSRVMCCNLLRWLSMQDDCSSAALARLSSVYNTTEYMTFESNSTVEIIKELSEDAAKASS